MNKSIASADKAKEYMIKDEEMQTDLVYEKLFYVVEPNNQATKNMPEKEVKNKIDSRLLQVSQSILVCNHDIFLWFFFKTIKTNNHVVYMCTRLYL